MCRVAAALAAALLLLQGQSAKSRFRVPAGFEVETVLRPEETGSLIALTFDSLGRPVISKERAHPTTVIGKEQKPFTDKVTHAQGMWFDGRTLYAIGNGPDGKAGLYRAADTDGDDVADTFETLLLFTGPMGEHGPHAIRRGPDGHPTLLLGNHTGIPRENIDPDSPLRGSKESQLLERYMDARGHAVNVWAPGATIWRADFERNRYTLLAGGFRNPYDHAFNLEGEVFTFDSDMEWDINLPWYREVRSVHAVPGGDYGWRTGSGKFPAYYLETLPPLREVGRGSPVGVEFYHHYVYPNEYFDAYFEGDWSRGRILWTPLERNGATYRATLPPTDFVYGEPLNVTDLEVGPDGFVYFVNGGRDTEGGLYRVVYRNPGPPPQHPSSAVAAARQPQPLSSWGHAALLARKQQMGEAWGSELEKLARDAAAAAGDRVQALFLLQRFGPRPRAALLDPLAQDREERVRAAALYVAGQHSSPAAQAIAARGLKDPSPFVRRRACEALVRMGADQAPVEDIYALLRDPDRWVRYGARLALERIPREKWQTLALSETSTTAAPEALLALTNTGYDRAALYEKEIAWLKRADLSPDDTLRFLRAFHLTALAGQVPPVELFKPAPPQTDPGAPPEVRRQVAEILLSRFPARDERLNREYARTLAYTGDARAIGKILAAMPPGNENQPLQIHYVYCLRTIKQGWTPEQKRALVAWFEKAEKWRGGASFPGFINNMFNSALVFFSEEEKKYAYGRIPAYAPLDKPAVARSGHELAPVLARRGRTAGSVSEQEILEYMLYDPMILRARPERGKAVYEKACAACHRFGDIGADYGPDLTTIASRFQRKDIIEATLWPSKTISDLYAAVEITTTDGRKFLGTVAGEDDAQVTLQVMGVGRRIAIPKKDIRSREVSKTSTMPEGLLDGFAMNEIADLFAFLQAGVEKGR